MAKKQLFEIGNDRNKQLQLRLYDDYTFDTMSLETDISGLIIEKVNDEPVAAFEHPYKNLYFCEGYKKLVPRCMIIPGHNRDTLLEFHKVLSEDDKPLNRRVFVNNIAKNRAESLRKSSKESWKVHRITLAMFWCAIILAICIGLKVAL